jgi:hypothetical protein
LDWLRICTGGIMDELEIKIKDLLNDSTEYCCYCGDVKTRFSCCGEVHFQTFSQMSIGEQKEFLSYED